MDREIDVIIAEDSPDAQDIILSFIKPLEDFKVIGVVDNGESLLELNLNKKPQLIIADINMPKLNGIEAITSCVKVNKDLKFIFTTAHDEYAVKAFELSAVDYVMKPIKKERLYVALEKVKNLINAKDQDAEEQKKILTIKMDRISYFIPFDNIIFIEKANRKTVIHTDEQNFETNETLDSIHNRLDSHFFRTHRSFIANLHHISHIILEGETYLAHFRNYSHYAHVSKLRINELYKEISYNE
ncbi:LytTR family DNA-binding domain-containing protein [Evansella sp. AB-P1]|uniref:LytR/AlgR family response regulator transcription factor n=1 Tax=Evansella sp. AB-P1 TaxID=3037653 RepID=UPI00241EF16E|nr:LytTR family DNA-binding domain-containing protein [Evansella sp. AB-P1]MDG5789228.1 LytTR family DNA-binding domain-containing protein [Evansella sp. AB-P1]